MIRGYECVGCGLQYVYNQPMAVSDASPPDRCQTCRERLFRRLDVVPASDDLYPGRDPEPDQPKLREELIKEIDETPNGDDDTGNYIRNKGVDRWEAEASRPKPGFLNRAEFILPAGRYLYWVQVESQCNPERDRECEVQFLIDNVSSSKVTIGPDNAPEVFGPGWMQSCGSNVLITDKPTKLKARFVFPGGKPEHKIYKLIAERIQ